MHEERPSVDVSPTALRELYTRLGLSPSEDEIAAVIPAIQRLYENDRLLEARLAVDVEPFPTPRVPAI